MIRLPNPPGAITEALSLEAAKIQLRVDHDDEDDFIKGLVQAAFNHCENYTRRALSPQRWRVVLAPGRRGWDWPQELPKPPFISLDAVQARWADGSATPVDPGHFLVSEDEPAEIMLRLGSTLPGEIISLRFDITCGSAQIPDEVTQSINLLIGNWYENRSAATLAQSDLREPVFGVSALLDPIRIMRI